MSRCSSAFAAGGRAVSVGRWPTLRQMLNDSAPSLSPVPPPKVAVSLCTFKRPDVLETLLERLLEVAKTADGTARIGVVVVDDDPAGSAEGTSRRWAERFELGLHYRCTGSCNISIARNQALEGGMALGEWLALIDDDCLPDAGWVKALVEMQQRTGADCVSGLCGMTLPPDAPRWMTDEPFDEEPPQGEDGQRVTDGYLKNTMISAAFLRAHGLHFDVALGVSSGEDAMFFHDIHQAGVHHRFARDARVDEMVPSDRARLGYQLRRRFWYGNTEAVTSIGRGMVSRPRMAASGAKKVAIGAVHPARRALTGRSLQWRFALAEMLRGLGRVLGAAGIKVDHR